MIEDRLPPVRVKKVPLEKNAAMAFSTRHQKLRDWIALVTVILVLIASGFASSVYTQRLRAHTDLVERSHRLLGVLNHIESQVHAVESGQRGFLISGAEKDLESFRNASKLVSSLMKELGGQTLETPFKSTQASLLQTQIDQLMLELESGIDIRRRLGFEAAKTTVAGDTRTNPMDSIHESINKILAIEGQVMAQRELTSASTYYTSLVVGLISSIAGLSLVISIIFLLQHTRRRAQQAAEYIRAEHDRLQASLDRIRRLESANLQLDQYMRSFVEQVKDYAIFAMDENCRATTWNNGVLQVLGFEELEFIGQDIRQLIFVPEAIELGIPVVEFDTAAKLGSASDDRWMMRKGGQRFWASGITSAVKDERGTVIGYSKVMRDLTDKKRDEDELAELATNYSEANRRMSEFMATLAHEIRNPLAPIRNALDLMGMSSLRQEDEELRILMDRQVIQLIRLIDDLLDISRIGRGKIALKRQVVDLRTVIQSAVEASCMFIQEKGQELQIELCQDEVWVNIDSARITQVVCNLLNNASRYSDAGSIIKLTLRIDADMGESGCTTMKVEDNGIGISRDRLHEIFQMFAQVDDSLGRGEAGLGIGLTLVKTLVELHRGTVVAESEGIEKGSVFTVCLPLANPNTEIPVEDVGNSTKEWPVYDRCYQVLVVEDLRALRMIMAKLLEKLGHRVQVAENGLEALESMTNVTPEIIFSDISMPGMTGYDLARKIRSLPNLKDVYLVAMSGYGQLSDRKLSEASGFNEHMVKPVDISKLRDFFDRMTHNPHFEAKKST